MAGASGCGSLKEFRTPQRAEAGYTLVLPGIEGRSVWNTNIVKGLADGGVPSAIEVYDWTVGPFLFPVNLRDIERNRREARRIAAKIVQYQDANPGKPVHLVGHSGGGGMAVLTLEALPPNRRITGAILLAAAISPDYDLSRALKRTDAGIWNFYSPYDMGFLVAGTTVMGAIDGKHGKAAGAVGFVRPWGLSEQDRALYRTRLHQQRYSHDMVSSGHAGGHFGWADRTFVAKWLAPLVYSQIDTRTRYAADEAAPQ